jgi:hypothetical protein
MIIKSNQAIFSFILVIVIFNLLFFSSCVSQPNQENERLKHELLNWIGKEIQLPKDVVIKVNQKDTLCDEMFLKKFKIITYVDSVGCAGCKFKLYEWRQIIKNTLAKNNNVSFLFYVHSNDYRNLNYIIRNNHFAYPIIYDYDDKLNKLNHLSDKYQFHTFLLNENNQIVLIGNPIGNSRLLNLYLQQISR